MPKKKIAIAIDEWVLISLDEAAEKAGVSRSSMVQEVVAEYLVERKSEKNREDYQRRAMEAVADMKAMAEEFDANPKNANAPSSLEILRAIREGRDIDW